MEDEQVVPAYGTGSSILHSSSHVNNLQTKSLAYEQYDISLKTKPKTKQSTLVRSVVVINSELSPKPSVNSKEEVPPSEYPGKLRWQTPSRTGTWNEPWKSARHLCPLTLLSTPEGQHKQISSMLRHTLSTAIVTYVGPLLPHATVNKWLCLLCEYLELNVDEEILVICLLRRYSKSGGRFIAQGDWARPQRWECVVAIACYLAVLLTEEFPGRTALDLKELLGNGFKFGHEQVEFLTVIDWKINVDPNEVKDIIDVCLLCINGDPNALNDINNWFSAETRDVSDAKLWNENHDDDRDRVIERDANNSGINKKKRPFTYVDNNRNDNDFLVPHQQHPYVIRRVDPSATIGPSYTTATTQPTAYVIPTVGPYVHTSAAPTMSLWTTSAPPHRW